MKKMFDEMPEELKELFGISEEKLIQTRASGEGFDYDNPPMFNEEIPDSVIPVESIQKLIQVRKLIIEIKNTITSNDSKVVFERAVRLSQSSPYAQVQCIVFNDILEEALLHVNTALHIHDTGIKNAVDEGAKISNVTPKEFAHKYVSQHTFEKFMKELLS